MQRNRLAMPDLPVRTLGSKHPTAAPSYTRTRCERHPPSWRLVAEQACDCDSLPHLREGCNGATGQGAARVRDNARLDFDMGAAHLNT